MRNGPLGRAIKALLVAAIVSVTAAGCVSVPTGGPVLSWTVTPGANGQPQGYMQFDPPSPVPGGDPAEVVLSFLTASASFVGGHRVAREYLTPQASSGWSPGWSATVFTNGGPMVRGPVVFGHSVTGPQHAGKGTASPRASASQGSAARGGTSLPTASVTIGGDVQASVTGKGTYAVPEPTAKVKPSFRYDLVMDRNGQWRISNLHGNPLLLTTTEFAADYQLRNLYFFNPAGDGLVPDPVYVPLQATRANLMNTLVQDLIHQPSDWLSSSEATRTKFPPGTTLMGNVAVDGGTATVTLGGAATRVSDPTVKEQISSQLLWTLYGAGQGQQQVASIALYIGDEPFQPSGQGNAVQTVVSYNPVNNPQSGGFYYLTTGGQVMQMASQPDGNPAKPVPAKPVKVATIGTGYTGLAVSPDGQYLAVLRGGNVYTGETGSASLARRLVGGFTSLSWGANDDLWAAGSLGVFLLTATAQRDGENQIDIPPPTDACGSGSGEVTAVRVAPDGVRVALVFGGQQPTLAFGAIAISGQALSGQAPTASITLSPFVVCEQLPNEEFKSLSWYGAEDVVTLSEPDDVLTEYPVNGSTSTTIPDPPGVGIRSVTAYFDGKTGGFVAGFGNGTMNVDASISGTWNVLDHRGQSPVYPG